MVLLGCQAGLANASWRVLKCGHGVKARWSRNRSSRSRSRGKQQEYWRRDLKRVVQISANSKADDSMPFEMTFENALKLLGIREGASFEEILRAKNSILDTNKGDQELAAQVEAAYDMLLMQSLMQRRAGKVVDNSIRYADVKQLGNSGIGQMPERVKSFLKNAPISVESPSANDIGIQTGVYGALMIWTFVNGVSYQAGGQLSNSGADVPGLILATGFGASLYFLCKKNVKLEADYKALFRSRAQGSTSCEAVWLGRLLLIRKGSCNNFRRSCGWSNFGGSGGIMVTGRHSSTIWD